MAEIEVDPPLTLDDAERQAETIWDAEKDDPGADAPPKTTTKKPARKRTNARQKPLEVRLEAFYMGIGVFLLPVSPKDGMLFVTFDPTNETEPVRPTFHAKQCASSLATMAEQSPFVRNLLEKMMTGGAAGAVITSHAALILAIMANHDMNPLELLTGAMGRPSPNGAPKSARVSGNGAHATPNQENSENGPTVPVTRLGDYS